jgi:hypothetical protein
MENGTRLAKPFYVKMSDAEWAELDDDGRAMATRNFKPGGSKAKPLPKAKALVTSQTSTPAPETPVDSVAALVAEAGMETPALLDLRNWNEDFDGIPASRIRSCIIFMLDYKKDNQWYRDNLTEGYLRRRMAKFGGITGARKIHEDTPPGWSIPEKNPMIVLKSFAFDGETMERKEIVRAPQTADEWKYLQGLLYDRYNRRNPNIVRWLADPNCSKCKGHPGLVLVQTSREKGQKFVADHWEPCPCPDREWKA